MTILEVTNNHPIWYVKFLALGDVWEYASIPERMELRDVEFGEKWQGDDVPNIIEQLLENDGALITFAEFQRQAKAWYAAHKWAKVYA